MATHERINEKTPNGGDYSEIFYFDKDGNAVDETAAVRCVIRECSKDGTLLHETWGECNPADNWYKENPTDKVWWKETPIMIGEHIFSFDKEQEFNLFCDYPYALTPEQKAIFDKENPFWADFFSDRT